MRHPSWAAWWVLVTWLLPGAESRAREPLAAGPPAPSFLEAYGRLPLSFEPNRGQVRSGTERVDFISRGPGYTLFLASGEAVLVLRRYFPSATRPFPPKAAGRPAPVRYRQAVLRLNCGAPASALPEGLEKLPGVSNYFFGQDPSRWVTRVPQYARVRVPAVYPGVDMEYYGNQGRLEYDFTVKPGADASALRLSFEGADRASLGPDGGLVLETALGGVTFRAPVLYQDLAGVRRPVRGSYRLTGPRQAGFQVGAYDRTRPLVIDPVLDYSSYLGGADHDGAFGIAVDAAGEAFVTGHTFSADFPATAGAAQTVLAGNADAFVAKFNAAGTALLYSTYLGGNGSQYYQDFNYGIAVDAAGNCFIAGPTDAPSASVPNTFPTTPNAYQPSSLNRGWDAYLSELDPSGSTLLYSTFLGGSGDDVAYGLSLDPSGRVYVAGQTDSPDFPATASGGAPFQPSLAAPGASNAFVAKFDTSLSGNASLVYSTYLGGSLYDQGNSVAADASGDAFVAGQTSSTDFPAAASGGAPFQSSLAAPGATNAFLAELNPSGTALVYSTYLGGSGYDQGNALALDAGGNAYLAGFTNSADFPHTAGAFQTARAGGYDAFLAKLAPGGTALAYSTFLGGASNDFGYGVAVDGGGNAYLAGGAISTDFPVTGPPGDFVAAHNSASMPNSEAFLARFDPAGAVLLWSTCFGGATNNGYENARALALDGAGGVYIAGETDSADYPTTPGAPQTAQAGTLPDAFIAKFGPSPTPTVTGTLSPTVTSTPTPTRTPAATATPSPTSAASSLAAPAVYPNPGRDGPVTLAYALPQKADRAEVRIFTTAFRKVFQDSSLPLSAGLHLYAVDFRKLDLANGLYYVVLDVEISGRKERFLLEELILR